MRDFKFFKGFIGILNVMDGQTYATASFYNPRTLTDDERLTRINERDRISEEFRNQEIITHEQYMLNRDMLILEERIRRERMVNHSRETDNQIRLYQATRVTTVNPNWRTKIKMGLQEMSIFFKSSPYGIMFLWALSTIVVILILSKILNVW
jgi:hypothetical protein